MRLGMGAVAAHTRDLGFEESDPLRQLVLRIGREILFREERGGIACASWPVVFVHRPPFSQASPVAVKRIAR